MVERSVWFTPSPSPSLPSTTDSGLCPGGGGGAGGVRGIGMMRAPHPPLFLERKDPTGTASATYNMPGDYVPSRPSLPPLQAHENEKGIISVKGPLEAAKFVSSWSGTQLSSPVQVDCFRSGLLAPDRPGVKFHTTQTWTHAEVKAYFENPRNASSTGTPVQDKSLLPIFVGPFDSNFRPRAIVNLDAFPDLDLQAIVRETTNDPNFRSARYLCTIWGSSPWYKARYNVWVLVESGQAKFFFCRNLTKAQREAFEQGGRDYAPLGDGIHVDTVTVEARRIMFIPPGTRYKLVFYRDSLITIGTLILQNRKNTLPALPTHYDELGIMEGVDMARPNALNVCIAASQEP